MEDRQLQSTYRVVRLTNNGPIIERFLVPELISDDEILIRIIISGICRSDLKEISKSRATRSDFGHEIVGKVIKANPYLPFSRGDLVCYDPHIKVTRSSGYGEYLLARGNPENLAKAFPKWNVDVFEEKMVFCEPLACAIHAVRKLKEYLSVDCFNGLKIGILGAGNAGTLIGLLVKFMGGDITVMNRSVSKLSFLDERKIFNKSELLLINEQSHNFDAIIAATTFLDSTIISACVKKVKHQGLILLFGGTAPDDNISPLLLDIDKIRRWEKLTCIRTEGKKILFGGTYGATSMDFSSSMEVIKNWQIEFPLEKLISSEVTLDNLCPLLISLSSGLIEFKGKIIVKMNMKATYPIE